MTYQIRAPETIREAITHFPPMLKQEIKEAFRFLSREPYDGEPLKWDLEGKRKFRIGHYRIIYEIQVSERAIEIFAVGHRRDIYEKAR